jgi:hypothetical protein
MSWTDILLAGGIAIGALYLLYRSIWKKRGYCHGCSSGNCLVKGNGESDRC